MKIIMTNNPSSLLDEEICLLRVKQRQQFAILNSHFQTIRESLKPINILKTTATEIVSLVKNEKNILNKMIDISIGKIKSNTLKLIGNNKVVRLLGRFL